MSTGPTPAVAGSQATETITPPTQTPTQTRTVPELDGVRGFAILLVLLCHFDLLQAPPLSGWPQQHIPLRNLLFLGWSGVDLFFVLSGFLITGILLDTRESPNRFSSFYIRRALRVLPLYFLSVVAYYHAILPISAKFGAPLSSTAEPWFWLHLSNWGLALHPERNWLDHFWSLGVEEQFYLFWPLVVFYSGPKRLPYVCVAFIALSFGLRIAYSFSYPANIRFLYLLTPFRMEPLAWGSLAAALVRRSGPPFFVSRGILGGMATAGLAGVAIAWRSGHSVDHDSLPMAIYGYTAFSFLYVGLVTHAFVGSGSAGWLVSRLRAPGLRSWGKYSYAIYIFHMPLLKVWAAWYAKAANALPEGLKLSAWLVALLAGFACSYGVALVSWNLIEKRFLRLKVRYAARHS